MNVLQKYRLAFIVESILLILLGIAAITAPFIATLSVELIVGWILLVGGGAQFYKSFKMIKDPGGIQSFISAIIYTLGGTFMLLNPMTGMITLTLLTALFFLFEGVSKISLSLALRGMPNWTWMLFSGIMALLMSGIILYGWPATSLWTLGLLIGVNMAFFGFSLLALTLQVPSPRL